MHSYAKALRPTLAKQVHDIRIKHNYTQEDMAELLRISPRCYSNLERGINGCSAMTLIFFVMMMTETEKQNLFLQLCGDIQQFENNDPFMPPSHDPDGTPKLR